MSTVHFRDIAKTAILNAMVADIDAGGAGGKLRIYSGTMPAKPEDAITGTLLAELTLSYPCGAVGGVAAALKLIFSAITQDSAADASGVASHFRIFRSDGATAVLDGDVTNTGGGGALQLNTVNIVSGGPVLVTAFSIAVP